MGESEREVSENQHTPRMLTPSLSLSFSLSLSLSLSLSYSALSALSLAHSAWSTKQFIDFFSSHFVKGHLPFAKRLMIKYAIRGVRQSDGSVPIIATLRVLWSGSPYSPLPADRRLFNSDLTEEEQMSDERPAAGALPPVSASQHRAHAHADAHTVDSLVDSLSCVCILEYCARLAHTHSQGGTW